MGKALVRIHRDRREIQYVVLVSIRTLVKECPSAFTPFLNDFFVKVCSFAYFLFYIFNVTIFLTKNCPCFVFFIKPFLNHDFFTGNGSIFHANDQT